MCFELTSRYQIRERKQYVERNRWIFGFSLTAVLGLVIWLFTFPARISERLDVVWTLLYGQNGPVLSPFFTAGIPIMLVVSTIVGYLLPKGFWLWGIAVVSLQPVPLTVVTYSESVGGLTKLILYLIASVILSLLLAVPCTLGSFLGAALSSLVNYLRR